MEEDEESLKDRVDSVTTTTFSIAGIPIKQFRRFMEFCEINAKVTKIFYDKVTKEKQIKEELCYAIGISRLLDIADTNAVVQLLFDRITAIESRMSEQQQPNKRKTIVTMGKHEVDESEQTK